MADNNQQQQQSGGGGGVGGQNPYQDTTFLSHPGYRPYQDPNAEQVDLSKFPEAKDSTNKIRGRSELLETLLGGLEPELIVAKGFYFFFYAAFGSLFPLMGVYFKQLGLNGAQAGILSGCRPLVEYLAAPFWVAWAERNNRLKTVLLTSLGCWILFTFPLGSIQPEPVGCIYKYNISHAEIKKPEPVLQTISKREALPEEYYDDNNNNLAFTSLNSNNNNDNSNSNDDQQQDDYVLPPIALPLVSSSSSNDGDTNNIEEDDNDDGQQQTLHRSKRYIPRPVPGISPLKVSYAVNYNKENKNWVSPSQSSYIFKKDDVSKVFFLLLLLVIIGEALSSPSIVLADTAVLHFLGDQAATRYGHQRMFGSLGWAISMFFIGIALDYSTFPLRKCKALAQEKNYTVCFSIFVVLMGLATLVGWRLKMPEVNVGVGLEMGGGVTDGTGGTAAGTGGGEYGQSFENVDIGDPYGGGGSIISGAISHQKTIGEGGIPHTTVFAQQNRKIPEWFLVLKHFKTSPNCMAFLGIAWLMGVGIGLIFTFLFWHLQDFGGSPTLFGLASVINHVSEVFAYFFSSTFISQLGHVKVLCIGLLCNVLRFLYITILKNPWWVLPFEFVQGITHAACWAACSSYLAHNTPPELRHQAQSVLQGLHHGLGRGFGAVVGGLFVTSMGTIGTFRLYGFLCLISLGGFGFLNFYRKDVGGFISELPQEEDPHSVAGAGETGGGGHLAPHGVPGSIPRVPSNTRLDSNAPAGGATYDFSSQQQQQQPPNQQYNDQQFYQQQPSQQGYGQTTQQQAPPTNPFFQ